jgi:hypothetical protein
MKGQNANFISPTTPVLSLSREIVTDPAAGADDHEKLQLARAVFEVDDVTARENRASSESND